MYLLVNIVWTYDNETTKIIGLYDLKESAENQLSAMGLTADNKGIYFKVYEDDYIESFEIFSVIPNTTYKEGVPL